MSGRCANQVDAQTIANRPMVLCSFIRDSAATTSHKSAMIRILVNSVWATNQPCGRMCRRVFVASCIVNIYPLVFPGWVSPQFTWVILSVFWTCFFVWKTHLRSGNVLSYFFTFSNQHSCWHRIQAFGAIVGLHHVFRLAVAWLRGSNLGETDQFPQEMIYKSL